MRRLTRVVVMTIFAIDWRDPLRPVQLLAPSLTETVMVVDGAPPIEVRGRNVHKLGKNGVGSELSRRVDEQRELTSGGSGMPDERPVLEFVVRRAHPTHYRHERLTSRMHRELIVVDRRFNILTVEWAADNAARNRSLVESGHIYAPMTSTRNLLELVPC